MDNFLKNIDPDKIKTREATGLRGADEKSPLIEELKEEPKEELKEEPKEEIVDEPKEELKEEPDHKLKEEPVVDKKEKPKEEPVVDDPVEPQVKISQADVDAMIKEATGGDFSGTADMFDKYKKAAGAAAELSKIKEDEFLVGLIEHRMNGGDVTDYITAKSVDYDKMDDEQLIKIDLKKQYPDLDSKYVDKLYDRDFKNKYDLDEDDPDYALGKELKRVHASKLRNKFKEEQSKFEIKARKEEPKVDNTEAVENFKKQVNENPSTQALIKDKRVVLGEGEDVVNFEIGETQDYIDMTVDTNKFWSLFSTENGVDLDKWYKTAAFAKNPDQFIKTLIDYGKTIGQKSVVKDFKNPERESKVNKDSEPIEDPNDLAGLAKAFAEKGVEKQGFPRRRRA